ncbi:DUF1178 family protein [Methylobrevis albus]|uniref:DUF1178 family protein n=1 Tax=Methylobrevis albus TaxID=2793297 RepID=A0A931MYU8_9HYPH|nr:DUF1178 family protein [Methylobrevis albus]MBH0237354.1 DUF1178 family protein [Methylobrevis albus]
MIRYALACAEGHGFDGWFRSSDDFDRQRARGLLSCAHCGSPKVEKALMAPSVRVYDDDRPATMPVPMPVAGPAVPAPVAMPDPRQAELIAAMRELKQKLIAEAENVGGNFPEEARKIHYGEAPERGIYGAASADEAKALIEEGIGILPLPVLPDERN